MKHNLPSQFSKREARGANAQTHATEIDDANDSFLGTRNGESKSVSRRIAKNVKDHEKGNWMDGDRRNFGPGSGRSINAIQQTHA